MKDHLHRQGLLALLLTAILWSSGGLLIKSIPLPALTIAGGRSAIAAIVMLLWLRKPKPIWTVAQWGSIISYTLTVILFVMATKLTTAANAIFLQYTAPIWVAIFSVFVTKEKLTRIDLISVLVVMAGMSVFFLDKMEGGQLTGNLIALASGLAFAGVALFMRAQNGVSTTESILFGNILTFGVCALFVVPSAMFQVPSTISPFSFFAISPFSLFALVLMGVFQLGVSYILYSWAMKHVTAIEAILITTLEPILNPLWVALFLGEVPSTVAIIGGLIVVAGVVARNFAYERAHDPAAHRSADH
ncbi:MAG: EamA/RhaT family transporter [Ignavibacteriae bacterium]|nr:MAG: EamA/RhaT family transporter [Ignavibacteriota bacterium]